MALRYTQYASVMVLIAALNIGVFGLPPFHLGLWFQSEPMFLAQLLCAALTAICLGALHLQGVSVFSALRNWPMRWFSLFLLWALLCSLISDIPMRALIGPAETGEGWLYYASIWLFTLLACTLLQSPVVTRFLCIALPLSLLCTALLQLLPPAEFRIFKWSDYLAFISIFYALCLPLMFRHITHEALRLLCIFIPLCVVISSGNNSALLCIGIIAALAAAWHFSRQHAWCKRYGVILACLVLLAPVLWGAVGWNAATTKTVANVAHTLFPNNKEFDQSYSTSFYGGSFGARILMNRMVFDALRDTPITALTGNGFGSYSDVLFRYALTTEMFTYNEGQFLRNWYLISGHAFHPHHSWVYHLLSSGVIGLGLWLAMFIALVAQAASRGSIFTPVLWLGYLLASASWFSVPPMAGWLAIAMAFSLHPVVASTPTVTPIRARWFGAVLCSVIAVGFLFFASSLHRTALSGEQALQKIQTRGADTNFTPLDDGGRGYMHQWWVSLLLSEYLLNKTEKEPATENDIAWLANMMRTLDATMQNTPRSIRIDSHHLGLINDIMHIYIVRDKRFAVIAQYYLPLWRQYALAFGLSTPTRNDLLTPYYQFWFDQLTKSCTDNACKIAKENITDVAEAILAKHPDDAVSMWYLGKAHYEEAARASEGEKLMRRAIALGAAARAPVSGGELQLFGGHP